MNVKLISKALHTLSLLSDEDYELVLKLRVLTEDEREMLMTVLEPSKPVVKKASKSAPRKIQHCAVCNWTRRAALHKDTTRDDYHEFVTSQPEPSKSNEKPSSKSPRASGMAAQLNKSLKQQRAVTMNPAIENPCEHCGMAADMPVHDKNGGYVTWHPFVPYAAPPAPTRSPANGGAGSIIQNSVDETVSAGAATGGSSE